MFGLIHRIGCGPSCDCPGPRRASRATDRAAAIPFDDFDTNALGTLNPPLPRSRAAELPGGALCSHVDEQGLTETVRNTLPLTELDTRWDFADPADAHGIAEDFPIDQSKHSPSSEHRRWLPDVMVQEYGRYFGMPTCCLRGGCLTGPNHSGVELARVSELPREG